MTHSKECFKCKTVKSLDEFYKHKMMADGHLNKCKICTKNDVGNLREENIEKIREYDRKRGKLPHRIEKRNAIVKKWTKDHPDRSRAQQKLRRAVKSGIVKKYPCLICGEKSEAHHPDYSRPLDVVWLCSAHHKQAHALVK